jgi:hypothetical protein
MTRRVLFAAASVALLAAGCSNGSTGVTAPADKTSAQAPAAPAAPKTLQLGQAATVTGENGGQLKVTPVGVLFHKGPYNSGLDGPENGWFVAVAIRAEAVSQQDRLAAPISGGGFRWRGQEQTIWSGEGNASGTPWVGSVPEFGDPIEPGSPEMGVETFDVPTKTGGRLLYINADGSLVSWQLPATDTGTGLAKVRSRIKLFS